MSGLLAELKSRGFIEAQTDDDFDKLLEQKKFTQLEVLVVPELISMERILLVAMEALVALVAFAWNIVIQYLGLLTRTKVVHH